MKKNAFIAAAAAATLLLAGCCREKRDVEDVAYTETERVGQSSQVKTTTESAMGTTEKLLYCDTGIIRMFGQMENKPPTVTFVDIAADPKSDRASTERGLCRQYGIRPGF